MSVKLLLHDILETDFVCLHLTCLNIGVFAFYSTRFSMTRDAIQKKSRVLLSR